MSICFPLKISALKCLKLKVPKVVVRSAVIKNILSHVMGGDITNYLKNASNAQLRCYEPLQNAHILRVCCAFSSARALYSDVICIFETVYSSSETG
jgi:hypothetical protein